MINNFQKKQALRWNTFIQTADQIQSIINETYSMESCWGWRSDVTAQRDPKMFHRSWNSAESAERRPEEPTREKMGRFLKK